MFCKYLPLVNSPNHISSIFFFLQFQSLYALLCHLFAGFGDLLAHSNSLQLLLLHASILIFNYFCETVPGFCLINMRLFLLAIFQQYVLELNASV